MGLGISSDTFPCGNRWVRLWTSSFGRSNPAALLGVVPVLFPNRRLPILCTPRTDPAGLLIQVIQNDGARAASHQSAFPDLRTDFLCCGVVRDFLPKGFAIVTMSPAI
jgi:hypothetical protein